MQVWKYLIADTTAANLLLTGDINLATINGPDVDRLLAQTSVKHTSIPIYFTQNLIFKQVPGALTNDKVLRQALSLAVDQKGWNQAALAGRGTLVTSFFLPNAECFDQKTKTLYPSFNLDKAKQVLTAAGYKGVGTNLTTPDGKPVKFRLLTSTTMASGGEYLQAQFVKLGAEVDLTNAGAQYGPTILAGNYDVAMTTTNNGSRETAVHMGFYIGPTGAAGGQNLFGPPNDPTYNRAARLAIGTVGKESCKWWAKVQERVLEEVEFTPLVAPTIDAFSRDGVTFIPGPRLIDPITISKS
jgi:peptide/nickel transport system substrate-binding protein